MMNEIIRETLVTVDEKHAIQFSVVYLSREDQDRFHYNVKISIDGRAFREKTIEGDTKFTCLMYVLFYIGNNIRDISINRGLIIDLFEQTFDEYIPLPKNQRVAWGE
jgi:hypothetical protein